MIKRWKVADFEQIPAFDVDPDGEWVKYKDVKYYLDEEYMAGYDRGWGERGEAEGIKND